MTRSLPVVLACADALMPRARYVLDTLLVAGGVAVSYQSSPPDCGPWLLYGAPRPDWDGLDRCVAIAHCASAWDLFERRADVDSAHTCDGLRVVFADTSPHADSTWAFRFDALANAFYFLSSWSERIGDARAAKRGLYADSVFKRLSVPQDVVDQYLARLLDAVRVCCERSGNAEWPLPQWPGGADYAVLLSHDVDFIPAGTFDVLKQGAKTIARHLLRQRDPADAARAGLGLARALVRGRDPYGCLPEIMARETALGVAASFQVAVGRRHPNDVNYRIEDDGVRDYLRAIVDCGFELCLHGSFRSTENPQWYVDEAALLSERLGRPIGSRQHFLSFDYDALFAAQERAGIEFDMSMGYPDACGPRAGFSYPYFPYCLEEDRPYTVLQVSLFLMDVTLRGYLDLRPAPAWERIQYELGRLKTKRGAVSVVWHPIVFGGARDPGYDALFWKLVDHVGASNGLATDGRTINTLWRERAHGYPSFA